MTGHGGRERDRSTDGLVERVERVEALHGVIDAQAAVIASLQERLDRLEQVPRSAVPASVVEAPVIHAPVVQAPVAVGPADDGPGRSPVPDVLSAPTSRRALLGRGAAAAAGAVIGGAAVGLATASPAAAAPGAFDGDPAVNATASPGSGYAVQAVAGSGIAVAAFSQSAGGTAVRGTCTNTSGLGDGVHGETSASAGIGVKGRALSPTGITYGAYGVATSAGGTGVLGEAPLLGVKGSASGNGGVGVQGVLLGPNGSAVEGTALSTTGYTNGVYGVVQSPNGIGVWGSNSAVGGTGVWGSGDTGVKGSGDIAIRADGTRSQLWLLGSPQPPLNGALARKAGEVVCDSNNDLWLCVAAGTPGTWRRVSGPATAGAFVVLPVPVRVYDSRPGEPPAVTPKTPLAPGVARSIDCKANGSGVPVGATAALVSIVATKNTQPGFVTVYKDGAAYPGTSNLVFEGNASVAVTTVTALSSSAKCAVRCNVTTDVIVDVVGYYQ